MIFSIINLLITLFYFFRFYFKTNSILISIAKGFGGLNMFNSAILLIYMCDNFITFILSCKYTKWLRNLFALTNHKKIHKYSAFFFCFSGFGHTLAHLLGTFPVFSSLDLDSLNKICNKKFDFVPSYFFLLFDTIPGITGKILFSLLMIILIFSMKKIRKNNFNLFFNVHRIYLLILPLIHKHGMQKIISNQEYIYIIFFPAIIFISLELFVRFIRFFKLKSEIKSIKFLECGVVELILIKPKDFNFEICQHLRINLPYISNTEWHPFTIASSPHEQDLIFYISPAGRWTKELEKISKLLNPCISSNVNNSGKIKKKIEEQNFKNFNLEEYNRNKFCRLDGPFGAPTQNFTNYQHLIFIASGIGATPFASIFFDILHQIENSNLNEENVYKDLKIEFFWVIKGYASCSWLIHLFQQIMSKDKNKLIKFNLIFTACHQKYDFRSFFLWNGLEILKKKKPKEISDYCGNVYLGRPDWDKLFYSRKILIGKNSEGKQSKNFFFVRKFIYLFLRCSKCWSVCLWEC